MIRLNGVSKGYHGQARVLDQVHLEVKKGEFWYVVGGSGAGKSTLLRILATQEAPSAGGVSLFGYDVGASAQGRLREIRRAIGYIPQSVRLIDDLSVYENIALAASFSSRCAPGAEQRALIHDLLERLGLSAKRDKPASVLSGGEAQRVAVARALARQPDIVIADEPTGAQDKDFTWSLMDLFLKAQLAGVTVVVATHDRDIVRRVRKKCAVLKGGRITAEEGLCIY